jgi:class 3 adenylate cyclase
VVFTDLSGSTETLNRLGGLLPAEHNEAVCADIERFGGREMKITGDGFFISLIAPPVRCVVRASAAAR